jgi:multidrug efflux pump subunit AcrA (membrane-fusion protein)
MPMPFGGQQFTAKDLEEAKLPPPPEEDSTFDVLLRPGLLADVEIIIDKIPNAISIPTQAVFEKDGKLVAYVKNGSTFEAREFKPLKRSESTMVVAGGLQPGEIVALADPTAKKDTKGSKPANNGAMGALPGK